jgi:N-acetylglucosaminyl-diphospho-decaprenol L-rhamnosyltransferase
MRTNQQVVGLLLNYHDAARSIDCIHSMLGQDISWVLVWDNSEDDDESATIISECFKMDGRVSVVKSAGNLGFSAGVNRGLECCVRSFPGCRVLLINNDARLLPGALTKLVQSLSKSEASRIAFPRINHGGSVLGAGYYHRFFGLLSWRPGFGYFQYASGCCLLIATDRITLPLFDEDFFMYGEDWELGWRLRKQPGALVHVDETLVEHDGAASSGLGSLFYESHMVAAHLLLARKIAGNMPEIGLLLLLRILMLLTRAMIRALRFCSVVPFKALWRGARIALRRASG